VKGAAVDARKTGDEWAVKKAIELCTSTYLPSFMPCLQNDKADEEFKNFNYSLSTQIASNKSYPGTDNENK
jgi:hypothetical protein